MMGEHLFEFDTEAELIEAFESFDEGDTGFVKCEEIRRWLSEVGERMDQEEVRLFVTLRYLSLQYGSLELPSLTLHFTAFTNGLATCCSRLISSLRAPLRIDMVTSTTANGLKFYGSTQKRAMLTHE